VSDSALIKSRLNASQVTKSRLSASQLTSSIPPPLPSRPQTLSELPGTLFTSPGFILGLAGLELVYGFVLFIAVSNSKRQQVIEPSSSYGGPIAVKGPNDTSKVVPSVAPQPPEKVASPTPTAPGNPSKGSDTSRPKDPVKDETPKPPEPAPVTPTQDVVNPAPTPPTPQVAMTKPVEPPKVKVEEPKLEPFGHLIDPDHDCKARRDPEGITIEIPGKLHVISPELMKHNAPRALTEWFGDFDLRVHIPGKGEIRPGINPLKDIPFPPFQGQGLILWHDKDNYVRLERTVLYEGGTLHQIMLESYNKGKMGKPAFNKAKDEPLTLRIERHGGEFTCSYSFDELQWVPVKRFAAGLPPKIRIGISATNISPKPYEARFVNPVIIKPPVK